MKVLYIGNYRDGTGWANACAGNILALDAAGVEVVPRAISFNSQDTEYPQRIKELEAKYSSRSSNNDCDTVIQHTLPHLYCYNSAYKNIGFFDSESHDFSMTAWHYYANMMDEIWVPSQQNLEAARRSGVKVPIKIVPHSIDINSYSNGFFTKSRGRKIQQMEDSFTFGFVGEFIERKNLKALVQAFHIEFDPREPVNLFIKTSRADLDTVQGYCTAVKNGLKIRSKYKEEIVLAGILPKDDYISVMGQINSFVMPSRGEAFCIPALEAMALGIPAIYTDGIGMDFCVGTPVKSKLTPCFGAVDTLPDIDTAETLWSEIDILELSKAMRDAYNKYHTNDEKEQRQECLSTAKNFDHQSVGKIMKELLSDS